MNYEPKVFGTAERRADWRLREDLEYRRQANRAAGVCAGITAIAFVGLRVAEYFGNVGGVALFTLIASASLLVGAVAAAEA